MHAILPGTILRLKEHVTVQDTKTSITFAQRKQMRWCTAITPQGRRAPSD